jgi:hypothetical protein
MKALRVLLASVALLALSNRANAATVLYSTGFEFREGYDPKYELVGTSGWVCDTSSLGGNGLVTNFLGGQAAYIGLFPLAPPVGSLSVWQPINYSPLAAGMPVVKFSVSMAIIDSTNGYWDNFRWSVYNIQGTKLFGLDFDNFYQDISYVLGSTNFVLTGITFSNNVIYTLGITMDFARNNWSATLDGLSLVAGEPITTTDAALNLGDIDAVWFINDVNSPGDNFMVFDNYTVTAEAAGPASARLQNLGRANGQFLLRLTGPSGSRYAIEAATNLVQWTALKTNTVTDGSFDFIDTAAAGFTKRFYRARLVP